MTGPELEEVAQIITTALFTHRATRGPDRLARGKHIVTTLEEHNWILIKENTDD